MDIISLVFPFLYLFVLLFQRMRKSTNINRIFDVNFCNLGKQIMLFKAIKHQRDKQIILVYLAGIQLFKSK